MDDVTRIPLHNRAGAVIAETIVDTDLVLLVNAIGTWSLGKDGYAVRSQQVGHYKKKIYRGLRLHRLIAGLDHGDPRVVDHINREPLDNRRSNLRIVEAQVNHRNISSFRGSSSPHRGVSWHKGNKRWEARVFVNGQRVCLGMFTDEMEAARVARDYRLAHMPGAVD